MAPPFRLDTALTPLLGLAVSLPRLPHQIPQAPLSPHCNPTQIHPLRAPVFRLPRPLLYTAHLPRLCGFQSPLAPAAHESTSPASTVFRLLTLCPPVHELSPQTLLFPGSPMFPRYTNWPPRVRRFPEPPCSLTRQFHLPDSAVFRLPSFALYTDISPRFCCFQAPLFPLYTDQPLAYVDPSCLRDSAGLRRVEGRGEPGREGGERLPSGKLLISLVT